MSGDRIIHAIKVNSVCEKYGMTMEERTAAVRIDRSNNVTIDYALVKSPVDREALEAKLASLKTKNPKKAPEPIYQEEEEEEELMTYEPQPTKTRSSKFFPTLLLGIFFLFLITTCVMMITDDVAERAQLTASIALGLAIGSLLRKNLE